MPTGWTPAAASATLEEWTRTLAERSNIVVLELPILRSSGVVVLPSSEWK